MRKIGVPAPERGNQNLESQRRTPFFAGGGFIMELWVFLTSHWLLSLVVLAVALFVIFVLPSIRIIGPTEVGLVTKRFAFSKLPDDNPIAFRGEAGLPGQLAHARLAPEIVADLPRRKASLGAGAGRRDRRGGRPSGPAAAHRRQVGRVGRRPEPHRRPPRLAGGRRAEGRAAPRAAPGQPHARPSGRLPRDHARARLRRARGPRVPAFAGPRPAQPASRSGFRRRI